MKRLLVAALFLFSLAGCKGEVVANDARITNEYGPRLNINGRSIFLPDTDTDSAQTKVMRDRAGKYLSFQTKDPAKARVLYHIAKGYYVGPLVDYPVDYKAIPELVPTFATVYDHTIGTDDRLALAKDVKEALGDAGLIRLLLAATPDESDDWEKLRALLPAASEAPFKEAIAPQLESAVPGSVGRAAREVDLMAPARAKVVAEKARLLVMTEGWKQPRAAAALLRATLARDPAAAGEIACAGLGKYPQQTFFDHRPLEETLYLALAVSNLACAAPSIAAALADHCIAYLRCNDRGPLSFEETKANDEPLCTKAQLDAAAKTEAARPPQEVFTMTERYPYRPALYAYASLLAHDRVPSDFALGEARRLYRIEQVNTPDCDSAGSFSECHCEESSLRADACLIGTSWGAAGTRCSFRVDDAKKTISRVRRGFH